MLSTWQAATNFGRKRSAYDASQSKSHGTLTFIQEDIRSRLSMPRHGSNEGVRHLAPAHRSRIQKHSGLVHGIFSLNVLSLIGWIQQLSVHSQAFTDHSFWYGSHDLVLAHLRRSYLSPTHQSDAAWCDRKHHRKIRRLAGRGAERQAGSVGNRPGGGSCGRPV